MAIEIPSVHVDTFDTSLRDGAQSLPQQNQFVDGMKPEIAHYIATLGVSVIEAGFPATPGDAEEVLAVAQTVGQNCYSVDTWENGQLKGNVSRGPVITGLSRVVFSDIEATWASVSPASRARIHTFVSTDSEHMKAKFPGKSPEEVLTMGSRAVAFAKELSSDHPDATVEFSAEAASTTDPAYLERVIKAAIEQGADIINVPDTVGQRDPLWMYRFYSKVIGWVMSTNPNAVISAHNHNDKGLAVANTDMLRRAAVDYANKYGVKVNIQFETTICGLGERAGNADVFPVVAGLYSPDPDSSAPVTWQFNPSNSVNVANTVMGYAGLEVPRQSPIVGSDIKTHRSGIHSDGVLKGGHRIYTPFDPTFWGHENDAVHEDGSYQGRRGREAANGEG
ncbi:MAG: 2-isopropylmalate synthase [Patescibacteria group bacterium]|nr:2-isopropylmalate synthase [Patescibacteria group bacterium]